MPKRYRGDHSIGMKRVMADGERHLIGHPAELQGLTKTGAEFPIELSLSTWETSSGPMVSGIIRDISERKKGEALLRKSNEHFHKLFDTSKDAIVFANADGSVIDANSAACRMFGRTVEEIREVGRSGLVDTSDPRVVEFVKNRAKCLGAVTDMFFLRKDGSKFTGEIAGAEFTDSNGRAKIYMIIRDITERIEAAQSLRAAEEQFRGLVEQSIAGIYLLQDNKFIYVNPRLIQIFGYGSPEELIGRDAMLVVAENDRMTVTESLRRRIEGEVATSSYEFTGVRKDGSTVVIGVHGARATHGGRPAIIGLMQDISEKRQAEEELKRSVVELERAFLSTVEVATVLSEMRDPYTAGHERRVAEIAVAIGAELGFDQRRQEGLRVAGHLHDVGKISIPSEILSKPGKLSPIEFQLIKGHAQASYDVLKTVKFPWPVAEVALQHHERVDGSGYPRGLKGEAILLESRIMAVADVIEAMSSHRPYRPGLGIDVALAEVERGRGTAYDPVVVDACLKLFREKGYAIPA
jgi:PAS domain S-box-containing protein